MTITPLENRSVVESAAIDLENTRNRHAETEIAINIISEADTVIVKEIPTPIEIETEVVMSTYEIMIKVVRLVVISTRGNIATTIIIVVAD